MLKKFVSKCQSQLNKTGSNWFVDVREGVVTDDTVPSHLTSPPKEEDGFLLVGETRSERSTVGPEPLATPKSQSQFYLDLPPSYDSLSDDCPSYKYAMGSGQSRAGPGANLDESTLANENSPAPPFEVVPGNQAADSSDEELISLGNAQSNGPIEVVPSVPRTVYEDIPFRLSPMLAAALHSSDNAGVSLVGSNPSRNYTYDFSLERTTLRDTA